MRKIWKLAGLGMVFIGMGWGLALGQSQEVLSLISTRIVPLQKEFVLGEPMKIRLEITNFSSETVKYKGEGFDDMLEITGSNEQPLPFIEGRDMVWCAPNSLLPNQTIVLADGWEISSQYLISSAGLYRIKFVGNIRNNMPPSNPVYIIVKPGNLKPMDILLTKLVPILPQGWTVAEWVQKKDFTNQVDLGNGVTVNGFLITLQQPNMKNIDEPGIQLLVTDRLMGLETLKKTKYFDTIDYLGNNSVGYIYSLKTSPEASKLWSDARDKIVKAIMN